MRNSVIYGAMVGAITTCSRVSRRLSHEREWLRIDECINGLDAVSQRHLARDCPDQGFGGSSTQVKSAFGSGAYAYGCCGKESFACSGNEYAVYDDYDEYPEEYFPEFCGDQEDASCTGAGMTWSSGYKYGILDGGATSSCGSFGLIQLIADAWEPLERYPNARRERR